MKPKILNFEVLYDGYSKSIENAGRLFEAATALFSKYPAAGLALSELGQEEIGKSFSFLAAFNYLPEDPSWIHFWKNFNDHRVKAYRAHFYEILSPLRIHIKGAEDVISLRNEIHKEKEIALYVGFDKQKNKFVSPSESITTREAAIRNTTLMYLERTAFYIKAGLDLQTDGSKEDVYRIFSEIPNRTLKEIVYQQDFPALLQEFSSRSELHAQIVQNLNMALEQLKIDTYKLHPSLREKDQQ